MPAGEQLVYRPWDPASREEEQAIRYMVAAEGWPDLFASPAYFDWRYRRSPWGEAVIELAHDETNGNLAGMMAAVPLDVSLGGERVRGGLALSTLTAAAYRGRGIFYRAGRNLMARCAERGWRFVAGYPNPQAHLMWVRYLRFADVGDVPLMLRPLRPSRLLRARVPWASALACCACPADWFWKPRRGVFDSVGEIQAFDAGFDALNVRLAERFPAAVWRDAEYLTWRYFEFPEPCRVLALRDGEAVLAYLAYRVVDAFGMRCGMILDFVTDGQSTGREAGATLLRASLRRIYEEGADVAGVLSVAGSVEHALLRKAGFLVCPKRFEPQPFVYMLKATERGKNLESRAYKLRNWFIGIGDYDVF